MTIYSQSFTAALYHREYRRPPLRKLSLGDVMIKAIIWGQRINSAEQHIAGLIVHGMFHCREIDDERRAAGITSRIQRVRTSSYVLLLRYMANVLHQLSAYWQQKYRHCPTAFTW